MQASRSWNIRFDEMIKAFGFMQTYGEACVYKKVSGSSVEFLIVGVKTGGSRVGGPELCV